MKRKVTQLFTVAVLATGPIAANANPRTLPSGAPACGNVQIKGERVRRCTATAPRAEPIKPQTTAVRNANPRPQVAPNTSAVDHVLQKLLTLFGTKSTDDDDTVAKPRRLRNGSPANGNVARRSPAREEPREEPTRVNNSN